MDLTEAMQHLVRWRDSSLSTQKDKEAVTVVLQAILDLASDEPERETE